MTARGAVADRPASTSNSVAASATVVVNAETQSYEAMAGTTPSLGNAPGVGFRPTNPHSAAGTRPEPAVSVPSANATSPLATATADPELEPPAMYSGTTGLRHGPYCGDRVPTRPVAN